MQSALSIDLSAASTAELSAIQYILEDGKAKREAAQKWADLLDNGTNEEIVAEARKFVGGGIGAKSPIVTADTYDGYLCWRHDILHDTFPQFGSHPRRPVYMLGGRDRLREIHSLTPNGNAPRGLREAAFRRYVKIAKPTILTHSDLEEFEESLSKRADVSLVRGHEFQALATQCGHRFHVTIKGKKAVLTASEFENVCRLYEIIRKTGRIEKRMEKVRATSRTRSA